MSYIDLLDEVEAWQKHTFPEMTKEGALDKMFEEIQEVISTDGEDVEELADLVITAVAACSAQGKSLATEILKKLDKNKKRTWKYDPERGNYSHIKQPQGAAS